MLEQPHALALHAQVVARTDTEEEVRAVVHVELHDLVERLHSRAGLALGRRLRRHEEVIEEVLPAVPPALAVVPELTQVLQDRRVPLYAPLPQVIEVRIRR